MSQSSACSLVGTTLLCTLPDYSACPPNCKNAKRFAYPNIDHLTTNGKDEPEEGSRMEDGLGEPGAGGEEGGREEEEAQYHQDRPNLRARRVPQARSSKKRNITRALNRTEK